MKKLLLVLGIAACAGAGLFVANQAVGERGARALQPRADGGDVRALVVAVPFTLEEPWTHAWRAERPSFRTGWLCVVEVDPARVRPTEHAQPVLCAGAETLERLNHGADSGRVVALLPGASTDERLQEPFYFTRPALPESLGARTLERELADARARGARTFTAAEIEAARVRGGAPIVVRDRSELDRLAAALILEHAPIERERAEQMLVPVTR